MDRRILVAVFVAGMLSGSRTAVGSSETDPPTHRAALAALRYFESVRDGEFEAFLRELRRPAPPPYSRVTLGAQQQIATFFASDGTRMIHPTPTELWEVPVRTPLPEDLFFLPRR